MSSITWDLRIDWSGNGTFGDTGENVTARAMTVSQPITVALGRATGRAHEFAEPGEFGFRLDNSTKDYSPNNGSSPIGSGNLRAGRDTYLTATFLSTTYPLARGKLATYGIDPVEQEVAFTCGDTLELLASAEDLSTDLDRGIRTGTALGMILDAVGWPAGMRDIDPGETLVRWWWEEGTNPLEAVRTLLQSEGPPAIAYVDGSGNFVFRGRSHRLLRAASLTSQATFKDSGADTSGSVVMSRPSSEEFYDAGWDQIANVVRLAVTERMPSPTIITVWEEEDASFTVDPSATEDFDVVADDPFYDAVVPADGTDFNLIAGSATATLSRTSGQTTTISITAGAGGAAIRGLALRARSVPVRRMRSVVRRDATSELQHGSKAWPNDAPWVDYETAKGVAEAVRALRKDRREMIRVTLDGLESDTVTLQQLARKVGDRVTIVETQTATNADYFIERIEHTISEGGARLVTVFHCERAPSPINPPASIFQFDGGVGHRFNEGTFAT